jgi:hypothetical protein
VAAEAVAYVGWPVHFGHSRIQGHQPKFEVEEAAESQKEGCWYQTWSKLLRNESLDLDPKSSRSGANYVDSQEKRRFEVDANWPTTRIIPQNRFSPVR